ncbi:hypothetical protein [Burkholderia pyrrocinia]|uniref:hypothetical protein n=1 Tax=Burkholderia pyrrocinia TaxID=60550 RepID=UPI002AB2C7FA|nr:hypothetical protein [Burkholderia pyrrocinia]
MQHSDFKNSSLVQTTLGPWCQASRRAVGVYESPSSTPADIGPAYLSAAIFDTETLSKLALQKSEHSPTIADCLGASVITDPRLSLVQHDFAGGVVVEDVERPHANSIPRVTQQMAAFMEVGPVILAGH